MSQAIPSGNTVYAPQQPLLAGTVGTRGPTGFNGTTALSQPSASRLLVNPSFPSQAGAGWSPGISSSSANRVIMPSSSPGGFSRGPCNTSCDPQPLGPGYLVSEREFYAGPQGGQYPAPQLPPQPQLFPVISENVIGRKVDIVEHERVVRALEHRIVQLETQLVAAQQPNPEVSLLKSTIANLDKQIAALSGVNGTAEGLRAELRHLEAENRQLEAIVRELEGRLSQEGRAYDELTERATRLANESRQIDNDLQVVLRERDQALLERDGLARQLGGAEQDLFQGAEGVRAVKAQMQTRIAQLEAELQQLIATLRLRDAEVRELTQQVRQQDGPALDFNRLKQDNIALIREVERSAEEIRILDSEAARLQAELLECRGAGRQVAPVAQPIASQAQRPMLGVEIKMLDDAAGRPDSVVVVHMVTPNGPSQRAGILPGDILKEWDGILLDSKAKFQHLLDQSPPGTQIILTVIRGKSAMEIPVTVGAAPANFTHHNRVVHSANRVDNVVQDRSIPGSGYYGPGIPPPAAGGGSRSVGSRSGY
eukprot:TRINITY_DN554_c0_g1_i2.p1 TRINITY_DN554_c0_g1~~TRINITY_DN554_c0_g1_i2.p1  ORF type:complete len:549 (-),score=24.13 TRINITY_DN554_c0_g1_i2:245-1861(-)